MGIFRAIAKVNQNFVIVPTAGDDVKVVRKYWRNPFRTASIISVNLHVAHYTSIVAEYTADNRATTVTVDVQTTPGDLVRYVRYVNADNHYQNVKKIVDYAITITISRSLSTNIIRRGKDVMDILTTEIKNNLERVGIQLLNVFIIQVQDDVALEIATSQSRTETQRIKYDEKVIMKKLELDHKLSCAPLDEKLEDVDLRANVYHTEKLTETRIEVAKMEARIEVAKMEAREKATKFSLEHGKVVEKMANYLRKKQEYEYRLKRHTINDEKETDLALFQKWCDSIKGLSVEQLKIVFPTIKSGELVDIRVPS